MASNLQGAGSGAASFGGRVQVSAGYATEGQGAGPLFVAECGGLFAQEGLDVDIRLLHGASNVVNGLLSGEVQFGNLAAPPLMRAVMDGAAALVFITGGINQQFLVARPEIRTLADLAGGKIGGSGPGDLSALLGHFVSGKMRDQGLQGVEVVVVPGGRNRLDGLFDGTMDAMPISPPAAIEAQRKGCHFLIDFADYGLNYTLGGIATTRKLVNEQPDLVRKFVRGYIGGMHRYKTDRAFVAGVQQEYSGLSDRVIAEETYDLTEPGFPRAPYPVSGGMQILLEVMGRTDPRAASTDPAIFIDDSFVRELDGSGYIARLYGAAR